VNAHEQLSVYDYLPDPVVYVRRRRSGGFLVYHDARCRHARGRPDMEPVAPEEVRAAILAAHARVRTRDNGRVATLWPCRVCLPPLRDWPWP
jgi:hypothetical protein